MNPALSSEEEGRKFETLVVSQSTKNLDVLDSYLLELTLSTLCSCFGFNANKMRIEERPAKLTTHHPDHHIPFIRNYKLKVLSKRNSSL